MDTLAIFETAVMSAVTGIAIGTGLSMAYLVNSLTQEKVRSGSSQQKIFAYALRVASVIAGYAIILVSARTMYLHTEQAITDAVFFILGIVGILFVTRQYLRKKDC